jgi:hypothetical protein
MLFRQTEVIRLSLIHEREPAGRVSIPGVRRYYVERGLQLGFKELFRFGFVWWGGHSQHHTPELDRFLAKRMPRESDQDSSLRTFMHKGADFKWFW